MSDTQQYIILFDSECKLCSRLVSFVIKRDKKQKFLFSSLQSKYAKNILSANHKINNSSITNTFYLIKNDRLLQKSTATIELLNELGGLWKTFKIGNIMPLFMRDKLYDWVAKNRYKWFGRNYNCLIPTKEIQDRFIDL